jgi:hypothetical protein
MTLIETKTLGTAAASIEFTSIPQDGTDLVVLISARSPAALTLISLGIFFNTAAADTSWRFLFGNGSSASSSSATGVNDFYFADAPGSSATSNTFGNAEVYIPNYTGSQQKSISSSGVAENNATTAAQSIHAGLCTKTAPITSLTVRGYLGTQDLASGSTVSLYKVTKGSDGIVTTS